jgi:hypothetical protein
MRADDDFVCPCGEPLLTPLQALMEPTLIRAREGTLTHAEALELTSGRLAQRLLPATGELAYAARLSQALYQQGVSWAIFSAEWLDALADLLRARGRTRVLEVAAGSGVLAQPMRRRGLTWRTTDAAPPHMLNIPIEQRPEACDALAALAKHGDEIDVVVWSWWVGGHAGDAALAAECARRSLPAIFVGEPEGGRTGSAALWQGFTVVPLSGPSDVAPLGPTDVPNWLGMHDRTWGLGVL